MIQLDKLDRNLIALLSVDASRTNVALARELGVSDNTIRNRIQRLIEQGVIEIVAIVDPFKVGHRIQIFSGIEVELNKAREVAEALAKLEEVTYVSYTTGEYDLLMVAVVRTQEELFHFLTDCIPAIGGIRRIRTNQVLKAVKRTFRYRLTPVDEEVDDGDTSLLPQPSDDDVGYAKVKTNM